MIEPYYSENGITLYNTRCEDVLPQLIEQVDLVLTDPPYGSGGRDGSTHLSDDAITGNRMLSDSHIWLMRTVGAQCCGITKDDSHCYVFSDWRKWRETQIAFETFGWELRSLIVWDKGNGMGEFWRSSYELILFLTKRKPRKLNSGNCYNVVKYPSVKNGTHPTEKPVDLCIFLMGASSNKGEIVLDPFAGSGTTLVAAKRLGRKAIGIEISEKYCEIAVNRLRQMELFNPQGEQ